MALPQDVLTETADPESVEFLYPDNLTNYNTIKYELGGVAIGDGSEGINVDPWVSRYDGDTGIVYLKNMTTDVETAIITVADLSALSFSFDSNMRPVIGYTVLGGNAYYYYYDTVAADYLTVQLPANSRSPVVTHDDKRRVGQQANYSDVMIFYVLNDLLYYRLQRERYATPHQIATLTAGTRITHVGMCTDNRLRIQLENGTFVSSP